jgi:hypothetical protein
MGGGPFEQGGVGRALVGCAGGTQHPPFCRAQIGVVCVPPARRAAARRARLGRPGRRPRAPPSRTRPHPKPLPRARPGPVRPPAPGGTTPPGRGGRGNVNNRSIHLSRPVDYCAAWFPHPSPAARLCHWRGRGGGWARRVGLALRAHGSPKATRKERRGGGQKGGQGERKGGRGNKKEAGGAEGGGGSKGGVREHGQGQRAGGLA